MSNALSAAIPETLRAGAVGQSRSPTEGADSRAKRMAATAAGGVLLAVGLRRRSLGGTVLAIGGGWLIARGLRGTDRPVRTLASAIHDREGFDVDVPEGMPTVERSITVGAPADELSEYWRDPEQLTQIMGPFAEVTGAGEDRLHWEMETPRGPNLTWETEITADEPGESLRWESLEGATIPHEGEVRFRSAAGDRGTVVTLRLQFDPPAGNLGAAAFQRLGIVPETVAKKALRRFKSLVETGEIPSLEHNPSARGSGDLV